MLMAIALSRSRTPSSPKAHLGWLPKIESLSSRCAKKPSNIAGTQQGAAGEHWFLESRKVSQLLVKSWIQCLFSHPPFSDKSSPLRTQRDKRQPSTFTRFDYLLREGTAKPRGSRSRRATAFAISFRVRRGCCGSHTCQGRRK